MLFQGTGELILIYVKNNIAIYPDSEYEGQQGKVLHDVSFACRYHLRTIAATRVYPGSGSIPGETRVASIAIYEAVESLQYRKAFLLSLAFLPISYFFLLLVNRLTRN
jgi:hypothetical protein